MLDARINFFRETLSDKTLEAELGLMQILGHAWTLHMKLCSGLPWLVTILLRTPQESATLGGSGRVWGLGFRVWGLGFRVGFSALSSGAAHAHNK